MAFSVKLPRKKKARSTKSLDERLIGTEPLSVSEDNYTQALNWYNYTFDVDKAKDFVLDYMKTNKYPKDQISDFRRCPKYAVPTTIGWQARIMMNGSKLSDRSMNFFKTNLSKCIHAGKAVAPTKKEGPVVSIQERTENKNNSIHSECERAVIDCREPMYEWLTTNEVTPTAAEFLREKYKPFLDEVESNDPQVKEAFPDLKGERSFWKSIISDLDRYINNKKVVKVRKPRTKKTKTAVDTVKSLKYQKQDPTLKLASVNPAEIVGAQQLWAYNTANRKLMVFNAVGPAGLGVKGTSIIGFDVDTSVMKTVRKPEETTNQLIKAGKVALRKFMSTLNTSESPVKARLNENTILLRLVK